MNQRDDQWAALDETRLGPSLLHRVSLDYSQSKEVRRRVTTAENNDLLHSTYVIIIMLG